MNRLDIAEDMRGSRAKCPWMATFNLLKQCFVGLQTIKGRRRGLFGRVDSSLDEGHDIEPTPGRTRES